MRHLIASTMFLLAGMAQAGAVTVELWNRPGGFTHLHIIEADRWLASGTKLVIADWQVSAAAIQVLYFKRKGGNVCYAKSGFSSTPALYFHLGRSRGVATDDLAHYIGHANAAKLGKLSSYSFKRFHPSVFGIRACGRNVKVDKRTVSRPSLMRW